MRDLSSVNGVKVNGQRIASDTDVEITIDPEHTWTAQDPRHVAGRGYGGFVEVKLGDNTSFRLERVDWSVCSLGLSAQQKVTIIEVAAEIGTGYSGLPACLEGYMTGDRLLDYTDRTKLCIAFFIFLRSYQTPRLKTHGSQESQLT